MDCQKCQDLLSDYVDGTLAPAEQPAVNAHLDECARCFAVHEDLSAIVGVCREGRGQYHEVPNERALWLRISNLIESEERALKPAAAEATAERHATRGFAGWMGKRWEISLPQMAMTLAAVVVAVALGTSVGLRFTNRQGSGPSTVPVDTNVVVGPNESVLRQDQVSIDYYNQRVKERRARWNPQMRDAFDRNMDVIDMTVNDAMTGLRQNPHDDVAEQMLNAALKEKMELLKEFSDY
jgi:anti-sigma factor RsiW